MLLMMHQWLMLVMPMIMVLMKRKKLPLSHECLDATAVKHGCGAGDGVITQDTDEHHQRYSIAMVVWYVSYLSINKHHFCR